MFFIGYELLMKLIIVDYNSQTLARKSTLIQKLIEDNTLLLRQLDLKNHFVQFMLFIPVVMITKNTTPVFD